jgi:hypothetical protein
MFITDATDTLITSGNVCYHISSPVLRTVISYKKIPIGNSLALNTSDLLSDKPGAVVGPQQNVDACGV